MELGGYLTTKESAMGDKNTGPRPPNQAVPDMFHVLAETTKRRPRSRARLGASIGILKEHDGDYCSKCDLIYFIETTKCKNCGQPTEPTIWYSRVIVERVVFTFVAPLVFAGIYVLARSPTAARQEFGFAGVYLMSAFLLFCLFGAAKTLMRIGGYTETFHERNLPGRARKVFSLARFLEEFVYVVGIIIAMFLFVGAMKLFRWASSGGK